MKFGRSKLRMYVKTTIKSSAAIDLFNYPPCHRTFKQKTPFGKDAIWKRSHQSSLRVPLAATHHGCVIENQSGLKTTVVYRLQNSTAIS